MRFGAIGACVVGFSASSVRPSSAARSEQHQYLGRPACDDFVDGAESRSWRNYPNCKCHSQDHVVWCGSSRVAARKFNVDAVRADVDCKWQLEFNHPYCAAEGLSEKVVTADLLCDVLPGKQLVRTDNKIFYIWFTCWTDMNSMYKDKRHLKLCFAKDATSEDDVDQQQCYNSKKWMNLYPLRRGGYFDVPIAYKTRVGVEKILKGRLSKTGLVNNVVAIETETDFPDAEAGLWTYVVREAPEPLEMERG